MKLYALKLERVENIGIKEGGRKSQAVY